MHPVLVLPELRSLIFSFVIENEPIHRQSQVGYQLLFVCQDFYETAQNYVWRRLPSFVPLLKTLPRDLWMLDYYQGPTGPESHQQARVMYYFKREMRPSDWNRFDILAAKVWYLFFDNYPHSSESLGLGRPEIAPSAFNEMHRSHKAKPLLPKLKLLQLGAVPTDIIDSTLQFLTPTLVSLHFSSLYSGNDANSGLPSLLRWLRLTCPNIQKLQFRPLSLIGIGEAPHEFGKLLETCRISSFTTGWDGPTWAISDPGPEGSALGPAIVSLGNQRTLKKLSLHLQDCVVAALDMADCQLFPGLTDLTLYMVAHDIYRAATTFIGKLDNPRLEKLCIRSARSASEIIRVLQKLPGDLNLSYLRRFHLSVILQPNNDETPEVGAISENDVLNLCTSSALNAFHIIGNISIVRDSDGDLVDIMKRQAPILKDVELPG
jgi:hypothetical protein